MAHHDTFTLDADTAAHAATVANTLRAAGGLPVRFLVAHRDDPARTLTERTGTVVKFTGAAGMSSDSVLMETPEGFKTFNTWLIASVTEV